MENRFARRASWERPELASVVLSPHRAEFRSWLDREVSALAEPGRSKLAGRLRDSENFVSAYNELAVASILRDAGLDVLYEADVDGLTPDLLASAGPDGRALIIDVWTREVPRAVRGANRAWAELVGRVAQTAVPVGLVVEAADRRCLVPPSSGEAKKVAASVRDWLVRSPRQTGDVHEIGPYRFIVLMDVPGLRARLAAPLTGGRVDSEVVIAAIREKVRRYRRLAERLDAPLVVVIGSDQSAPLDLALLRSVLTGEQVISFTFSPAFTGLIGSSTTTLRPEHRPPAFNRGLSAVGFVEPRWGDPLITLIPVPEAARPLGPLYSHRVMVDRAPDPTDPSPFR